MRRKARQIVQSVSPKDGVPFLGEQFWLLVWLRLEQSGRDPAVHVFGV